MYYNALEGLKMRYTVYCRYLYTIRPIYSLYVLDYTPRLNILSDRVSQLSRINRFVLIEKEEVARRKRLEPSNIDIYTI